MSVIPSAGPEKGAQIFLTGVTGFVGKVVLEELARRRQELQIDKVFVLIRKKKERTAAERFRQDVAASQCFSNLPAGWESFVSVIDADLTDLSLDPAIQQELYQNLTHVIHCAASVAFDLPVKEAAEANITSALNLLEAIRPCQQLKAFVDVSTAYVSPHPGQDLPIPEQLVKLPLEAEAVYQGILDGSLQEKQLLQQMGHPNTYTLTKCLSEHLLNQRKGEIPLSIVRPSIIAASWQYPHPGWIDSYAAFAGFVALIGAGVLKAVVALEDTTLDIVPCDEVAHRVIETAFWAERAEIKQRQSQTPPLIQHVVSGLDRGSRSDICIAAIEGYFQRHPVQFWPQIKGISNGGSIWLQHWLEHKLPTMAVSTWLGLTGKQRQKRQVERVLSKIEYFNAAFPYFTHNSFRFQAATPLGIEGFDPKLYIDRVCQGVHTYLMKANPAETLLGGSEHRYPKSDLRWACQQPEGNWAIRTAAYIVRKGFRRSNNRISFDRISFERSMAKVPSDSLLMLVPSHRSYMDFLLCSYLFFAHPELNIAIPRIAAASDFSKLPLLGWFFQQTHAFYIQRGQGKPDPTLSRRLQELAEQNDTLEFFVEGTRSRSRQFMAPRRGILRAMQNTGVPCTLLPIAISYDLVPEMRSFLTELSGGPKQNMRMSSLMKWILRLVNGQIHLGQIHITCGEPLALDSQTDVHALSHEIMAELQSKTAVSTLHLQAFLDQNPIPGLDLDGLQAMIEARGGQVLESSLRQVKQIDRLTERTLRYHWMHYFYPDALALYPGHPAISRHVQLNGFAPAWRQAASSLPADQQEYEQLQALLEQLFAPIASDYALVLEQALSQGRLAKSAAGLVASRPESFLPIVEEAMKALQADELLMELGHELVPGPRWSELKPLAQACRWQPEPALQAEHLLKLRGI